MSAKKGVLKMHEIRFEAFPYKMGKKEIFADVNETA